MSQPPTAFKYVLDVCEFLEEVTADRILIKIDVEGAEIDILGRLAQWDGLGRIRRIQNP